MLYTRGVGWEIVYCATVVQYYRVNDASVRASQVGGATK